MLGVEVAEQREAPPSGRSRRARPSAPSAREPRPELAPRLVGERHRHDLLWREGSARDLPRDAARDRGRLAGPGAGEDAQRARAPFRLRRAARGLALEWFHRATVAARSAVKCHKRGVTKTVPAVVLCA